MRAVLLLLGLICAAFPLAAHAKPKLKIAVAPLAGDGRNKVAQAVADALTGKDFAVTGPKDTGREIGKLGLSDELTNKEARTLTAKLGVAAVIDGKVGKAGNKRSLHLEIHRRGKPSSGFTIEFKSTGSDGFRRAIHDEIRKKLEGASEQDPDEDEEEVARAKQADDDRKRKQADDEARQRDDDDRKRKQADDEAATRARQRDDSSSRKKRIADASEPTVRRRKAARPVEESAPMAPLVRVGVGASVAQRQLSYDVRANFQQPPPRVLTYAPSGRFDAEVYPFALAGSSDSLANLGLAASYDKTFGLSIKLPNQALRAPINQSHYTFGARYRWLLGDVASVTVGLDYARRHYIADRSSLMTVVLDAPDVDYAAISPSAALSAPITSSVTLFGGVDALLVYDTGAIQQPTSYGAATVYGLEAAAGAHIAFGKQLGLRITAEYSQIKFTFKAKGAMSTGRDNDPTTADVNGAADRSIGLAATLALVY